MGFFGVKAVDTQDRIRALHVNWWLQNVGPLNQMVCDVGVAFTGDREVITLMLPFQPEPDVEDLAGKFSEADTGLLVFDERFSVVPLDDTAGKGFIHLDPQESDKHYVVVPCAREQPAPLERPRSGMWSCAVKPAAPRASEAIPEGAVRYIRVRFRARDSRPFWHWRARWHRRGALVDFRVNDVREGARLEEDHPLAAMDEAAVFLIVPWRYYAVNQGGSEGAHAKARVLENRLWEEYLGRAAHVPRANSLVYYWTQQDCHETKPVRSFMTLRRDRALPSLAWPILLLIAFFAPRSYAVANDLFDWLVQRATTLLGLGVFGAAAAVTAGVRTAYHRWTAFRKFARGAVEWVAKHWPG